MTLVWMDSPTGFHLIPSAIIALTSWVRKPRYRFCHLTSMSNLTFPSRTEEVTSGKVVDFYEINLDLNLIC